jgi:hypothetical protein
MGTGTRTRRDPKPRATQARSPAAVPRHPCILQPSAGVTLSRTTRRGSRGPTPWGSGPTRRGCDGRSPSRGPSRPPYVNELRPSPKLTSPRGTARRLAPTLHPATFHRRHALAHELTLVAGPHSVGLSSRPKERDRGGETGVARRGGRQGPLTRTKYVPDPKLTSPRGNRPQSRATYARSTRRRLARPKHEAPPQSRATLASCNLRQAPRSRARHNARRGAPLRGAPVRPGGEDPGG